VTAIASSAFEGCTSLTSITIPDSVTSIGSSAFSGCSSLVEMTIPFVGGEAGKTSSDTYQYPFGYIFGTSSYTGGTAVKQSYYGSSTFSRTSTTYYIPATLRRVTVTGGNLLYGAFYNCSMLTDVTIFSGVTSIGGYAFRGCTGLASITIPSSVTSIGSSAFLGCASLTSITIPASVTSIASSAFRDCTGLTSIAIPDSVTSIGGDAFSGCASLTSITIPDSVTSIGGDAFRGCTSLTHIYCEAASQPSGWSSYWKSGYSAQVVWGYTG
ncbi:MAG: leucine-rich repeat domain-containing protein, partial [Clostridia bacterium]|nr:leucine-rich repeat domain-containing protein [Clostridia bacterium]